MIFNWARYSKIMHFIVTLHGGEIKNYIGNRSVIYKILTRPSTKKIFENAHRLVSPSDWQLEGLRKIYKDKTVKIPNGVDTAHFTPTKLAPNKLIALYVGRLIELKGVRLLIDAARDLPDIEFWFAGHGELESELTGQNITYLGFVGNDELSGIYKRASFCVLPSYYESFSLVGLESMSSGLPIICTAKGFNEYAHNGTNSLIVKSGSKKLLSDAIKKLADDSQLRKKLGKNARKTALDYDWAIIARRYISVYGEVIANAEII